jgi:uncharacterized protein (DUF697 family)
MPRKAEQTPDKADETAAAGEAEKLAETEPLSPEARLEQANSVVRRNMYWAMGAGILPLPLLDVVAISGVQLKMLRELSNLYDFKFSEGVAKKAVMSLLVGLGGVGIGGLIGTSLFKLIPFVGLPLGIASVPVVSGAFTHAVGQTFIMHFEAGGTLLDFDPKAMRTFFESELDKAKEMVAKLDKDKDKSKTSQVEVRVNGAS